MQYEQQAALHLHAALVAGVDMRAAQVAYFKSRTSADLIASKNAEKKFDQLASTALQSWHRSWPANRAADDQLLNE